MIHPSYVDLMEVVNKNVEEGETPVINSRYSIVMATAKRARQIVDGDEPLVKVSRGEKPLSIAVDELNQAEIRILSEDEVEEEYIEPADPVEEMDSLEADVLPESDDAEQEAAGSDEAVESAGEQMEASDEVTAEAEEDTQESSEEAADSEETVE